MTIVRLLIPMVLCARARERTTVVNSSMVSNVELRRSVRCLGFEMSRKFGWTRTSWTSAATEMHFAFEGQYLDPKYHKAIDFNLNALYPGDKMIDAGQELTFESRLRDFHRYQLCSPMPSRLPPHVKTAAIPYWATMATLFGIFFPDLMLIQPRPKAEAARRRAVRRIAIWASW